MRKFAILLAAIGALLPALLTAPAGAASARTFVSGTGNDTFPCSQSQPCLTFAGALAKTSPGGEINCLGAGEYASSFLNITFAVTISCEAATAGVLAPGSGAIAIQINAAATDDVTLRGLDINGLGSGDAGVFVIRAKTVHIENCAIRGFGGPGGLSAAIQTSSSANTMFIYATDSVLSSNRNGVVLASSGGYKIASLKNLTITGSTGDGVLANDGGVFVNVSESVISGNGGSAVNILTGGSEVNIDHSTLANNVVALRAGASGATIRAISNNIYNNTYAFGIAGGATIATNGQNRTGGNVFGQDPNASLTLK